MKHRSVSQIENYSKCAYAFYLQRVLKVPQKAAGWFIQGKAVHTAIEAYEMSQRRMSVDDALKVFHGAWAHEQVEAEEKQPDHKLWLVGGQKTRDQDLYQRRVRGEQQVADYIDGNPPDDEWLPAEFVPGEPAIEVPFELDLGGVKVVGFIDSILEHQETGALRIRDVKTGTQKPTQPFQMATYKIAVEELTGFIPDSGVYWMCKDKQDAEFDRRQFVSFSRDLVSAWYIEMDKSVKQGAFPGNPGNCFTCTVRQYCHYDNPNPLPLPEGPSLKAA